MKNIKELSGQHIKLSEHSITLKNENGKTAGVIRADRFLSMQPNKQIDYVKIVRNLPERQNVYVYDNQVYYFFNQRTINHYANPLTMQNFPDEVAKYTKKLDDAISAIGTENVICAYLD